LTGHSGKKLAPTRRGGLGFPPNNIDDLIQNASDEFPEEKPVVAADQKIQEAADAIAQ